MRQLIKNAFRAIGYDVSRHRPGKPRQWPPDVSRQDCAILERVSAFTMTSVERQVALIQAVRHIVHNNIAGSFVECGVWRGGSSMVVALTLIQEGDTSRDLYLYDTFAGMTPPRDVDKSTDGTLAQAHLDSDADKSTWFWAVAGLEDVQRNMRSTGYPQDRLHYVEGPVETTVPAQAPTGKIALLRLDTDWYESTHHELVHFFPLLCEGGILIIDDYGDWAGARKAVDDYLAECGRTFYLHRIDNTGRLLVKV